MGRICRIGTLAGAILLPATAILASGIPAASAASAAAPSGSQYCYRPGSGISPHGSYACLNAWGGGPRVNVSTNNNTQNNDFTVIFESNGYAEFKDTGNNAGSGKCIGDYNNSTSDASTGLVACGTNGVGAGWGTQFIPDPFYCLGVGDPNGEAYQNVHWNGGYLGPVDTTNSPNGSHFYLNKPSEFCFDETDAAG
jgi:hypothetical protein